MENINKMRERHEKEIANLQKSCKHTDTRMKRFRAEKIGNEMVITENRRGHYKANNAEEIRLALTWLSYKHQTAEVLVGRRWLPLGNRMKPHIKRKRCHPRLTPEPQALRGITKFQKFLKVLHLYKDPLEKLIYKGK